MNQHPTPREIQALRLVAEGKSNREIASDLRLSIETVKDHIAMAAMRLQARNRAHAAVIAVRKGLL